jgi:predicted metal-binding membrane protein
MRALTRGAEFVVPMFAAARTSPWPLLFLASLTGWTVMFGSRHWIAMPYICGAVDDYSMASGWQQLQTTILFNSPSQLILAWFAMLLAMTPPLLARPIAHLWSRDFPRRGLDAIFLFAFAYVAIWIPAGCFLVLAAMALHAWAGMVSLPSIAVAAAIALVWQASPAKQACLNLCHRLPPCPRGIADWNFLRHGALAGLWCVGACWALMLLPLLAGKAHMAVMAASALLMLLERQAQPRTPKWRVPSIAVGHSSFKKGQIHAEKATTENP